MERLGGKTNFLSILDLRSVASVFTKEKSAQRNKWGQIHFIVRNVWSTGCLRVLALETCMSYGTWTYLNGFNFGTCWQLIFPQTEEKCEEKGS